MESKTAANGDSTNVLEGLRFIEFNERRAMRGARAARMEIGLDGDWLWMDIKDIKANIKEFGEHEQLTLALQAYQAYAR